MAGKTHITTTINGEETEFLCEPRQTLLEVLRDDLGLTGTKEGHGTTPYGILCRHCMDLSQRFGYTPTRFVGARSARTLRRTWKPFGPCSSCPVGREAE